MDKRLLWEVENFERGAEMNKWGRGWDLTTKRKGSEMTTMVSV